MERFAPTFNLPDGLERILAAAEQGVTHAQWLLGMAYLQGRYVSVDLEKAHYWLLHAANEGMCLAESELAQLYLYGRGCEQQYHRYRRMLSRAAKHGHAPSQTRLGADLLKQAKTKNQIAGAMRFLQLAMYNGEDMASLERAVYLATKVPLSNSPEYVHESLSRLAKRGDATAQYALGWICAIGYGRKNSDTEQAVCHFTSAAEAGHTEAQRDLGRLWAQGLFGSIDEVVATTWLYRAAENGDGWAQALLATRIFIGKGTFPDVQSGLHWFFRSMNSGFKGADFYRIDAQLQYAREHISVEEDLPLLKAAISVGFADAKKSLLTLLSGCSDEQLQQNGSLPLLEYAGEVSDVGVMLRLSRLAFDSDNSDLGLFWLQAGVELSSTNAMLSLAEILMLGTQCRKDVASGTALLNSAMAHGGDGGGLLAFQFLVGHDVVRNPSFAARVNEAAAAMGDLMAQNNLSQQFMLGDGVEHDAVMGRYWVDRSTTEVVTFMEGINYSMIMDQPELARKGEAQVLQLDQARQRRRRTEVKQTRKNKAKY